MITHSFGIKTKLPLKRGCDMSTSFPDQEAHQVRIQKNLSYGNVKLTIIVPFYYAAEIHHAFSVSALDARG
jgi:hypothetical protein